jgi:hypothetical protein
VEDSLDHPIFAKIRKPSKELCADTPVIIDFEDQPLDKDTLRQLFLKVAQ